METTQTKVLVENPSKSSEGSSSKSQQSKNQNGGPKQPQNNSGAVVKIFEKPKKLIPLLRPSLFPNFPPFINFAGPDEKTVITPAIRKHLKFLVQRDVPNLIKEIMTNSGFILSTRAKDWTAAWWQSLPGAQFLGTMQNFQKYNHFPAVQSVGHKHSLWFNYHRFQNRFGDEKFNFIPMSFIIPKDLGALKEKWDALSLFPGANMWIVKPAAGSCGTGITVINDWSELPTKGSYVVQRYITHPLLIQGRKCDLRIYALVTSFNPLRIYLSEDGIARFAPLKYSYSAFTKSQRFMHLTNYSVSKHCDKYVENKDANSTNGHQWKLTTFWRYLETNLGVQRGKIIEAIEDLIIKMCIAATPPIGTATSKMFNRYNGFELFGLDIMLDQNFKPWLLECNVGPSFDSYTVVDVEVKSELLKETLNVVGFHLPPSIPAQTQATILDQMPKTDKMVGETVTFDEKFYGMTLTTKEMEKQKRFVAKYQNYCEGKQTAAGILTKLTADDIRIIMAGEDELTQCHKLTRIFPTNKTKRYLEFFEPPFQYYNMLLSVWERKYHAERQAGIECLQDLCLSKRHHLASTTNHQSTTSCTTKCDNDDDNVSRQFVEPDQHGGGHTSNSIMNVKADGHDSKVVTEMKIPRTLNITTLDTDTFL